MGLFCGLYNKLFTASFIAVLCLLLLHLLSWRGESVSHHRAVAQGKSCCSLTPTTGSPNSQNKGVMSNEVLKEITDLVTARTLFATKEVLTSEETALYMGVSRSYLYKLTMRREIPHYKPMGKMCYFNRQEIEAWLQANRVATNTELNEQAVNYCNKRGAAS